MSTRRTPRPDERAIESQGRAGARQTIRQISPAPTAKEQAVIDAADRRNPAGGHISHQRFN